LMGAAKVYPSTGNPYDFGTSLLAITLGAFGMGIFLGAIDVLLLSRLFARRAFWQKILFKTSVYFLSIILLDLIISLITNGIRLELSMFHPEVIQLVTQFAGSFFFWSIIIYSGFITMVTLFISEVSDYMGGGIFNNFFTGKYHNPREEERIFMFLDMRSSTTIAERLGHLEYFRLLNRYYADTTDAIVETSGEVYQYAGDEIIVSWNLKKGLTNNNCLRCFFLMKETFETLSENYIKRFGLVPEFKAGFHCGEVTAGEIGVLKKEIFFTGDVLNTTARIQSMCNEFGTDILVSQDLISQLPIDDAYELTAIGECELKGRREKVNLFSIAQNAK